MSVAVAEVVSEVVPKLEWGRRLGLVGECCRGSVASDQHPPAPASHTQHPAGRQGFDKLDAKQWFFDLVYKRQDD